MTLGWNRLIRHYDFLSTPVAIPCHIFGCESSGNHSDSFLVITWRSDHFPFLNWQRGRSSLLSRLPSSLGSRNRRKSAQGWPDGQLSHRWASSLGRWVQGRLRGAPECVCGGAAECFSWVPEWHTHDSDCPKPWRDFAARTRKGIQMKCIPWSPDYGVSVNASMPW